MIFTALQSRSFASRLMAIVGALLATLALVVPAIAQDYPNKPIKLIIPYPPGGATDVIGRIVALKLSEALGQQLIVDNRAGATGSIGAAATASSPADGYTLLLGALTSHSIRQVDQGRQRFQYQA